MDWFKKVCLPLKTLKSVLDWAPPSSDDWGSLVLPLVPKASTATEGSPKCRHHDPTKPHRRNEVPKTLFCHDMKGGYLDDRFVDGSEGHDSFRFFRWSAIDIFVYFSHSLVTIPPLGWINAGHQHGVPVLGTIITEGPQGEKIWERILSDEECTTVFCTNLVLICVQYNFDGYLLNVENDLAGQRMAFSLCKFVRSLKSMLNELKPGTTLLWYDSITLPHGHCLWQNQLNDRNKTFFDACDGIFLNYTWNKTDLEISKYNAKGRPFDVYVGVDVFGRGCFGGGGFNTCKAVKVARSLNMSIALFAPGWVHENQSERDNFLARELKFWSLLYSELYISGPSTLPLTTSFCQGYGYATYDDGIVVSRKRWYNLSKQNYQPTDLTGYMGCGMQMCLLHCTDDAFVGGGCLSVTKCSSERGVSRLFVCDFKISAGTTVKVTTVTKNLDSDTSCDLNIVLTTFGKSDNVRTLYLVGKGRRDAWSNESGENTKNKEDTVVEPTEDDKEINSWKKRQFQLDIGDVTISEIGCYVTGGRRLLFGHFSIGTLTDS